MKESGMTHPTFEAALDCIERNGAHLWGSPVAIELGPGEPLAYGLDCLDCGIPATGTTLADAMEVAQALDRLDRALVQPEPPSTVAGAPTRIAAHQAEVEAER